MSVAGSIGRGLAGNTGLGIVLGVAVIGGIVWILFGDKLKSAAAAVGTAVNPASDKNLAYRGVNAVGAAVSDDPSWSLGSWLYDQFNPAYNPNAPVSGSRQADVRREAILYGHIAEGG